MIPAGAPLARLLELDTPSVPAPASQPAEQEPVKEVALSANEAQEAARLSLDFLAGLALPTVFRYFFPDIFQQMWAWLVSYAHQDRTFPQLAIGLPRGFSKTTFVKLFCLYVILFTKRTFILVCAANEKKAVAIIADICDFLDEPNIKKLFGDWRLGLEKDEQILKKFGFRGRNIILAAGTVSTVRGLNIKHQRPDVMIFDDIQSREDADSETVSKQIETDMYGTAMKAKSPHGCMFIFIGNMYPTKWSLLRRLKDNPEWVKFIAGGIIQRADGSPASLWEELQPLAQLLKEFQNDLSAGRPEIFYAEVLNDPNASVNLLIDTSKIPQCPYESDFSGGQHQGNFIIIDPSNDKHNSDDVSLGYFEIWDGKPVAREIIAERLSPGDSIKESLKLCFKYNCSLVCVESNAYQYSYLYWSNYICQQMGIIGINFAEIYSGHRSKNSRILDMFKQLLASEQYLSQAVRPQVFNQITSFNPVKTNNVDGILDLITYASKVLEIYGEYIASHLTLELQDFKAIPIRSELETSPF